MASLSVTLNKSIILDDPRDLVASVTLSVASTVGIDKNIFVVKYIPPASPSDGSTKSFYNVAYVDQFEDVPTVPENKRKVCFIRTSSVTKTFANHTVAETWCTEIYQEIMRLLSTYAVVGGSASAAYSVIVTENGYTINALTSGEAATTESTSSTPTEVVESPSESVESSEEEYEVIDLTYNGNRVTL